MTRVRSRSILAAAAVVALVAGACSNAINFLPPEDPEAPLFEVESRNAAWAFHWSGYYVDGEGRVYRWNRSQGGPDEALSDSVLTPAQLAAKYTPNRTLVKTLPAGEALQRYQLVSEAARGDLAELKMACADAGGLTLSAWVHDPADGNFHRILLHQRGDMATTRRSAAARTLWRWLDQVVENNFTGCDPYAD